MSQLTWAQRREFAEMAKRNGVAAAAEAAGRKPDTIRSWARKLKISLGKENAAQHVPEAALSHYAQPAGNDDWPLVKYVQHIKEYVSDDTWHSDPRLRGSLAILNAVAACRQNSTLPANTYLTAAWEHISDWSKEFVNRMAESKMVSFSDEMPFDHMWDELAGQMLADAEMYYTRHTAQPRTADWPPVDHDYIGTLLNDDDLEKAQEIAVKYIDEYREEVRNGRTDYDIMEANAPENFKLLWETIKDAELMLADKSPYTEYVRNQMRLFATDAWELADPVDYLEEGYFDFLERHHRKRARSAFAAAVIEFTAEAVAPSDFPR